LENYKVKEKENIKKRAKKKGECSRKIWHIRKGEEKERIPKENKRKGREEKERITKEIKEREEKKGKWERKSRAEKFGAFKFGSVFDRYLETVLKLFLTFLSITTFGSYEVFF
jgi:hypothetical protein